MNTRQEVAAEIRAAMGRKNTTQSALAGEIGMSRAALSERLSGQRAFDTDELDAIATALDVNPLVFLIPSVPQAVGA